LPLSRYTSAHRYARQYATAPSEEPKKKQDGESGAPRSENDKAADQQSKQPGQSAPGFEHLYDNSSPTSPPPSDGKYAGSSPATSKLTPEEEKAIDSLLANLKLGMPAAQAKDLERAFQEIKEQGIPTEVREIMNNLKSGAPMDLATAAKLVRMTTRMARKAATNNTNKPSTAPTKDTPKQKAGAHDPGPQSREESKKEDKTATKHTEPWRVPIQI